MSATASDPLIGQLLDGKYEIEERIGAGSMGAVYRAQHVILGAPRAIKVMKRGLEEDPSFVERFQNEAHLAESLRHPNLVALYDFARLADGCWYIVTEFVPGKTLAELLMRGERFSSQDVAYLLGQIAEGMALAHRKGIIHRDVSPDNVMVTEDEAHGRMAKLLDFGIAKNLSRVGSALTDSTLVLGKAGYAPPEQMGALPRGQAVDGRADVFSLAAVAYRILCAELPWRSDSLRSYLHDLLVRPEAEVHEHIRQHVPEPWQEVFVRGLARRREARTPSMQALKVDMLDAARRVGRMEREPLGAGLPRTRTMPLALVARSWRGYLWRRRGRASYLRWAAGGAFLILATAATTSFLERARPRPSASASPPPAVEAVKAEVRPPPTVAPAGASAGRAPRERPQTPPPPAKERPLQEQRAAERAVPAQPDPGVKAQPEVSPPPLPDGSAAGVGGQLESEPRPAPPVEPRVQSPRYGSLSLSSDSWVVIAVDGGPAQQTPVFIARLEAGRHTVRAARYGYREKSFEVEILEGQTTALRIVLEREK
jgi:serine/threonine-protein kinase